MPPARLTRQQQAWVESYVDRVKQIARGVRARLRTLDLDEFVSAGNEALVRVATRYDPTMGVPFQAYAYTRVRGAMIDAVRAANPTTRRIRRAARALALGQCVAEEAQAREARHHAGGLDTRSFAERFAQAVEQVKQTSAAVIIANAEPERLEQHAADDDMSAEELVGRAELRAQVQAALAELSPDERALITDLYMRERTMQALAHEQGVNKSTISRRHARVLAQLAERLAALAPHTKPAPKTDTTRLETPTARRDDPPPVDGPPDSRPRTRGPPR